MWAASPTRNARPCRKVFGHALMHLVERGVRDLVVRDARHDAGHQRLREFARLHVLVAGVLVDQEHHPPQPGNLQQEIPALRVGDVADRGQAGDHLEEIERRRDHQQRSGQVKPSNSMPSERRTALLAPSAPIRQRPDAVSVVPLRSIVTVDARRCLARPPGPGCRTASRSSDGRASARAGCASASTARIARGRDARWRRRWRRNRTRASSPSLLGAVLERRATSPCAISGSAAPSASQHVERRRMEGRGARFFAERPTLPRTPSPARRRAPDCAAATRPTGPAPAMRRDLRSAAVRESWPQRLLDLRDAGLGDDVAVLHDLIARGTSCAGVERHGDRYRRRPSRTPPSRRDPSARRSLPCSAFPGSASACRLGASSANQPLTLYSGRPASVVVGVSGSAGEPLVAGDRERVGALGLDRAGDVRIPLEAELAPCRRSGRGRIARCCDRARG